MTHMPDSEPEEQRMNQAGSRRDFLATASLAGVLSPLASLSLLSANDSLYAGEIIDTHQHLWNLKKLRLPWVEGLTGEPKAILGHDYLLSDYDEASRGLRIHRTVYMEVDVAEDDEIKEAAYVAKVCAGGKTPMAAAVISGRPASEGFARYLDQFKGQPAIKGLRQVLHSAATPPKYCLTPEFVRGIQTLGERGLTFDLCLRSTELGDGAELIDRCPGTRFVLDHCGNPLDGKPDTARWRTSLAKIANARNQNVMCKISGLYGSVSATEWPADRLAPIVKSVIDLFGWDRVMFAGDWPVVNLGASLKIWVETVKQIVRSDQAENQKKLFHTNAAAFYRLK
jgi:L-fuconolactonase